MTKAPQGLGEIKQALSKPAVMQSSHARDHQDEDSSSLYYMYGFKNNENNIQDVFKFEPATRNMFISDHRKPYLL